MKARSFFSPLQTIHQFRGSLSIPRASIPPASSMRAFIRVGSRHGEVRGEVRLARAPRIRRFRGGEGRATPGASLHRAVTSPGRSEAKNGLRVSRFDAKSKRSKLGRFFLVKGKTSFNESRIHIWICYMISLPALGSL